MNTSIPSKEVFKYCYFCGKDLNKCNANNADPLVIPNEDGDFASACHECNKDIVLPTRKVLRNVSEQELTRLLPYVKVMPVELLKDALTSPMPLNKLRIFEEACEEGGFSLKPEQDKKHLGRHNENRRNKKLRKTRKLFQEAYKNSKLKK